MATHISSPFVAKPGEVFVTSEEGDWLRCPESEAGGRKIIKCVLCSKPAAQVDHFWPYYSRYTLCPFHAAPTGWAKTRWGKKWHWIEQGGFACSVGLRYKGRVLPGKEMPEKETVCKRCYARKHEGEDHETDAPGGRTPGIPPIQQ